MAITSSNRAAAIVSSLFPRRGRAAPPPLTRHISLARAVPISKRIVTGLLVYRRSLSQDLRLINVLNPVLGLNIFDSDRDRLVSQVQCASDGLGDLIGKSRLVRFRSTRMELYDDMGHCYLLRLVWAWRASGTPFYSLTTSSAENT